MAIIDASVYMAILNTHEAQHQASITWLRQMQQTGEQILVLRGVNKYTVKIGNKFE